MTPIPLLAFALRHELVAFDSVLDLARTTPPWEAAQLGWGLAASLDDAQLDALDAAYVPPATRSYPIQRELIARQRYDAALGTPPAVPFDLFEKALPRLGAHRDRWIDVARTKLVALLADAKATTRDRLAGAKCSASYLPTDARASALELLENGYAEDIANGAYDQLDLNYGDIDPTLELARTHASVGSIDRAIALLDQRETRAAYFFNAEEATDAARLVGALSSDHRAAFTTRFERWIGATPRGDEHEDVIAVRWWTDLAIETGAATDDWMLAIVDRARMAEALAELAYLDTISQRVRHALQSRLIDLAEGYVAALRSVTSTGKVTDWSVHATSVRQLRSSVTALARETSFHAPSIESRLRTTARDWSQWIATQDISFDSLPYVYTAIAFARRCREEIPEAVESVAKLMRGSVPIVVEYEGWDALFTGDRAVEIANAALHT